MRMGLGTGKGEEPTAGVWSVVVQTWSQLVSGLRPVEAHRVPVPGDPTVLLQRQCAGSSRPIPRPSTAKPRLGV